MTETRDFDRLARAWLDLMPDEAPDRVIDAVLQAAATTPQLRRPIGAAFRRSFQMNRFSFAAVAVAIVAVLVGGVVVLSRLPASNIGGPSPSPSATTGSPPASAAAGLPPNLLGYWVGTPRFQPGQGTLLQITTSGIQFSPPHQPGVKVYTLGATVSGGEVLVQKNAGAAGPCQDQIGSYAYHLSASGQTLTMIADQDSCSQRAPLLAGTWWLADCHVLDSPTCLGQIDAGTYGSQLFAWVGAHGQQWLPRYGALTFTVPDGWASYAEWPTAFGLAPVGDYAAAAAGAEPAETIEVFSHVLAESQVRPCSGQADPGVPDGMTDGAARFIAWLRKVPGLEVSPTSTTTIDGHLALSVDLTVTRPPTAACRGTDHLIEYLLSGGWYDAASGSTPIETHAIGTGSRDRIILVDLPDASGYLVAIVLATNDARRFDGFAQQALPIVASFQFK